MTDGLQLRSKIISLQDRACGLLGCAPDARATPVGALLSADKADITAYWLQLVVSTAIATLGLILGSIAVIIGAMLIAPLMGPMVGLAMGIVTGSPLLALRSFGRVVASVALVLAVAAGVTWLSPLREVTAEIASRTSPTVLDLLVAAGCALAGAHATLRPVSSAVTAAAGTAVGISLVPPVCAAGHGLATSAHAVSRGAMLLFVTNAVAIVAVGALVFVVAGFTRVNVAALERAALEGPALRRSRQILRRLHLAFTSRWGVALRVVMPAALLATVIAPLGHALEDLSWELRARAAVREAIGRLRAEAVAERVLIQRPLVDISLVLLGDDRAAADASARLTEALAGRGIVDPRVRCTAIPEARSLEHVRDELLAAAVKPPPVPHRLLQDGRGAAEAAVRASWPAGAAGDLVSVGIAVEEDRTIATCFRLGAPLGDAGREAIEIAARAAMGGTVRIVDEALPAEPVRLEGRSKAEIEALAGLLAMAARHEEVATCAMIPPRPAGRTSRARHSSFRAALDAALRDQPRTTITDGEAWSVGFALGACPGAEAEAR